jgi:hypothetical protein
MFLFLDESIRWGKIDRSYFDPLTFNGNRQPNICVLGERPQKAILYDGISHGLGIWVSCSEEGGSHGTTEPLLPQEGENIGVLMVILPICEG